MPGEINRTGSFYSERFVNSIFELVDIWTETTEESEYLELLDLLTQGITKVRRVTGGAK